MVSYEGHFHLGDELWKTVGKPVGMPHLEEKALKLLDEAISILSPPEAHVRVVEVDTFTVRGSAFVSISNVVYKGKRMFSLSGAVWKGSHC